MTLLRSLIAFLLCVLVSQTLAIEDLTMDRLVVRLLGPDGKPVTDAWVGSFIDKRHWRQESRVYFLGRKRRKISDRDGKVVVPIEVLFRPEWPDDRKVPLYALEPERRLVALTEVTRQDVGRKVELKLQPACHVKGTVTSTGLKRLGRPLSGFIVSLKWGDNRLSSYGSKGGVFEFFLPPGNYQLRAYGGDTYGVDRNLDVAPRERETVVQIDLPETRLSNLFGKPAPSLQKIKAWKNGDPVKLADLKGKAVLLDFWGYWCQPCVREMPDLVRLHESYRDRGLAIIAVHDDSVLSIEEMDDKLKEVKTKVWGGKDLPFHVALDGGGEVPIEGTDTTARGATTAAYGVTKFPTTLLIDKQGIVVSKFEINNPGSVVRLERTLGVLDETDDTFETVYRLGKDEVLLRIAPEMVPLRQKFFFRNRAQRWELFEWDDDGLVDFWSRRRYTFDRLSLHDVLRKVIGLSTYDYDITKEFLDIELDGDWVVRRGGTSDEKVQALDRILRQVTRRKLRLKKRLIEREVIVASGRFKFDPLPGTFDAGLIHAYCDTLDPGRAGGGGSGRLEEFLKNLAEILLEQQVLNLAEDPHHTNLSWSFHLSSYLRKVAAGPEKKAKLRLLLANLSRQTGLTFQVERRAVGVWIVFEQE